MMYVLPFEAIATGAVAGTYKTLCGILVPNTAGIRCRLRGLIWSPADATPGDRNINLQIKRIASAPSLGTPTTDYVQITVANIGKIDSQSRNATVSGAINFTTEPTTYETAKPPYQDGTNDRGRIVHWWEEHEAIVAQADQFLGLLGTPRSAAAITGSGQLMFEEF